MPGPAGPEELLRGLVQPDGRSCGASSIVAVRMLADPAYAARLAAPGAWAAEVLTAHREVTALRDRGRLAVPWPRALGTPPWAVARRLGADDRRRWRTRVVWPWRRSAVVREVRRVLEAGDPVVLYVGSRRLPRHAVVVLGATRHPGPQGLRVWNPALGTATTVADAALVDARLGLRRWDVPWFVVAPRGPAERRGGGATRQPTDTVESDLRRRRGARWRARSTTSGTRTPWRAPFAPLPTSTSSTRDGSTASRR